MYLAPFLKAARLSCPRCRGSSFRVQNRRNVLLPDLSAWMHSGSKCELVTCDPYRWRQRVWLPGGA